VAQDLRHNQGKGRRSSLRAELFPFEYIVDLNGTAAARRVGYANGHARVAAQRLLARADVKAKIAELIEARKQASLADADAVLVELVELYRAGLSRFLSITETGRIKLNASNATSADLDRLNAVKVGKDGSVELRVVPRERVLELIGKHVNVKAFADRLELEVRDADALVERLQRARGRGRGGAAK